MTKGEQIMRLTVQKMNGQPISNRKYVPTVSAFINLRI